MSKWRHKGQIDRETREPIKPSIEEHAELARLADRLDREALERILVLGSVPTVKKPRSSLSITQGLNNRRLQLASVFYPTHYINVFTRQTD